MGLLDRKQFTKFRVPKPKTSPAERYGLVAMQHELEGTQTLADEYYRKSLGAYPTPIMMAFYHLKESR